MIENASLRRTARQAGRLLAACAALTGPTLSPVKGGPASVYALP